MLRMFGVMGSVMVWLLGGLGTPSLPMWASHHSHAGHDTSTPHAATFQGKPWKLLSWQEGGGAIAILGDRISAKFTEQSLSGSGGCNSYSAEYRKLEGQRFQIRPILSTRMACADIKVNEQERKFFRALMMTQQIKVNVKGQLTLQYRLADGTEGLLTFQRSK